MKEEEIENAGVLSEQLELIMEKIMDNISTCIGCGCNDLHACHDEKTDLPCSWIVVDREISRGVCSCCAPHLSRWDSGDRAVIMIVARITKDGHEEPFYIERNDMASIPHLLGSQPGEQFHFEWIEMSETEFEGLPQFEHIQLAKKWIQAIAASSCEEDKGNLDKAKQYHEDARLLALRVMELGYDVIQLVDEGYF